MVNFLAAQNWAASSSWPGRPAALHALFQQQTLHFQLLLPEPLRVGRFQLLLPKPLSVGRLHYTSTPEKHVPFHNLFVGLILSKLSYIGEAHHDQYSNKDMCPSISSVSDHVEIDGHIIPNSPCTSEISKIQPLSVLQIHHREKTMKQISVFFPTMNCEASRSHTTTQKISPHCYAQKYAIPGRTTKQPLLHNGCARC